MTEAYHTPVLSDEVVRLLNPQPGHTVVDATAGGGGHAALLGSRIAPGGVLVTVDQDPAALAAAAVRLRDLSPTIIPIRGNFRHLGSLLSERGIGGADAILLDLGVSSRQLDEAERGFSFRWDAPLDMRMDPSQAVSAAELLGRVDEAELTRILWEFGEERWAARIARKLIELRNARAVATTGDLAEVVKSAIPKKAWPMDIHPATRTFQAIRIAVNDELAALVEGLDSAVQVLRPGGRLAVISYHSLEDRIVKQSFIRYSGRCQCPSGLPVCACGATALGWIVTRKPVMAGADEIARNPRSRSARLRVLERLSGS